MTQILMWLGIVLGVIIALGLLGFMVFLIVAYRQQIADFFRAIMNPLWNNWILLILWIATVTLFVIAIWQGGGEPIGLKALRQASERPRDSVVEFYNQSRAINKPPQMYPPVSALPDRGTWAWWEIALGSLALSIIFIPIAMHDEVGKAWSRAWERWEQRPARIQLQSRALADQTAAPPTAIGQPQPPSSTTTVTQTIGGTFWSRMRRRFSEQLPSELAGEFLYETAERIIRGILRR